VDSRLIGLLKVKDINNVNARADFKNRTLPYKYRYKTRKLCTSGICCKDIYKKYV